MLPARVIKVYGVLVEAATTARPCSPTAMPASPFPAAAWATSASTAVPSSSAATNHAAQAFPPD